MNNGEIIFGASYNRILDHWANHDTGTISAFRVYDWPAIIGYEEYDEGDEYKGIDNFRNKVNDDIKTFQRKRKIIFNVENWKEFPDDLKNELKKNMVSYEENMRNHRRLRAYIQQKGYGYIEINGRYRESALGKVMDEKSLFVFDKDDKGGLLESLQELGHNFDQDSITYAPKRGNYSLYDTSPFNKKTAELRKLILGDEGLIGSFDGKMSFFAGYLETGNIDENGKVVKYKVKAPVSEEKTYSKIRSRGFEFTNYKPVESSIEVTSRLNGISRGGFGVSASYAGVYYAENELKKLIKDGYVRLNEYPLTIFAPESIGEIQSVYDVLVNHDFAIVPINREVIKRLQDIPYGYFECNAHYNKRRIDLYVFVDIDDDKCLLDELNYRQIDYIEARKPFDYEIKKKDKTILNRICIDKNNSPEFYLVGNMFFSPTKY